MGIIYNAARPLIFLQDPEKAHDRIIRLGKFSQSSHLTGILEKIFRYEHPSLQTNVLGINFANPVGLAAGFDKNAELCRFIESLGFGFEEIGSATARGGEGNPKPRLFRLVEDEAIINRMGLNNHGAYQINKNLKQRTSKFPIGINIAKTHSPEILGDKAIQDYLTSYELMTEGDYVTLNISCPNTREGKNFEEPVALNELLGETQRLRRRLEDTRPWFLKLSPNNSVENFIRILQVGEDNKVSGYVISNTSLKRLGLKTSSERLEQIGKGGLSGKPIRDISTTLISLAYNETKKPIIGGGGIFTAEDVYSKITAGASLIQIYTGMIYQGPGIARAVNKGLVEILHTVGFDNISQAVGANV